MEIEMTGEIEPRDLRVSDAEREHVGQLLQKAVGQGRLTLAEFETRMTAAMAARTRGDLNVLVADIAELKVQPAMVPARVKDAIELRSGMGDLKRTGYWVVPPVVKIKGGMGTAKLDFTRAELTSPVTTIEFELGMGDLKVVLPAGATIDYDDARCAMGSINDKTVRGPGGGTAHFVLRGHCGVGSIKIVQPRRRRLGPFTVHRHPFRITLGRD